MRDGRHPFADFQPRDARAQPLDPAGAFASQPNTVGATRCIVIERAERDQHVEQVQARSLHGDLHFARTGWATDDLPERQRIETAWTADFQPEGATARVTE